MPVKPQPGPVRGQVEAADPRKKGQKIRRHGYALNTGIAPQKHGVDVTTLTDLSPSLLFQKTRTSSSSAMEKP
jgi:hypothetical protein